MRGSEDPVEVILTLFCAKWGVFRPFAGLGFGIGKCTLTSQLVHNNFLVFIS